MKYVDIFVVCLLWAGQLHNKQVPINHIVIIVPINHTVTKYEISTLASVKDINAYLKLSTSGRTTTDDYFRVTLTSGVYIFGLQLHHQPARNTCFNYTINLPPTPVPTKTSTCQQHMFQLHHQPTSNTCSNYTINLPATPVPTMTSTCQQLLFQLPHQPASNICFNYTINLPATPVPTTPSTCQ